MYSAREKNKFFRLKGFTILELIIVIVITSLVFSVGVAGFRDFQKRNNLGGAVARVKSHLRLAQEMSLSGVRNETCITANLPTEAIVFEVDSTTSYKISGRCSDGSEGLFNGYSLQDDYPGVEISGGTVVFNTLGRGVEGSATVTLTQSGSSIDIDITKGGEIYE